MMRITSFSQVNPVCISCPSPRTIYFFIKSSVFLNWEMGLSDHSQLSEMFVAVGLLIASNKFQKENLELIAIIPALRRLKKEIRSS